MRMRCHDSEAGEDFTRCFGGHNIDGGRANFNSNWDHNYTQTSGLREGSELAEVSFTRGRGVYGSVSVGTSGGREGSEDCSGFIDFKMKRGPLS